MFNKYAMIRNNKGVVLFLVIIVIMVVTLLAGVVLNIMRSNSRHTLQRLNRTRAYYALYAAMVFTREQLRTGAWATGAYSMCSPAIGACTHSDPDIPYLVNINVGNVIAGGSFDGTRLITLTANYAYTE